MARTRILVAAAMRAPYPGFAGMGLTPFQRLFETVHLGAVAQLRLESLSFFVVLFFLLSFALMRVWNAFRQDFTWLPALSYRRAIGLLFLWGLAMSTVLSMI